MCPGPAKSVSQLLKLAQGKLSLWFAHSMLWEENK